MNSNSGFLIVVLLTTAVLSSGAARDLDAELKFKKGDTNHNAPEYGSNPGGFFRPGGGFTRPGYRGSNGWGNLGGGYGVGYGGPGGGYAHDGVVHPSVVCSEKGPCYKKKLTCPAKCFTSYSRSGRNYGAGGGGGGCTMDCKKKCIAYC